MAKAKKAVIRKPYSTRYGDHLHQTVRAWPSTQQLLFRDERNNEIKVDVKDLDTMITTALSSRAWQSTEQLRFRDEYDNEIMVKSEDIDTMISAALATRSKLVKDTR